MEATRASVVHCPSRPVRSPFSSLTTSKVAIPRCSPPARQCRRLSDAGDDEQRAVVWAIGRSKTFNFTVAPVNDTPTLTVMQTLTAIAEKASTASAHKVASLAITASDGGANALSLTGSDAMLFEIKNGTLRLKAGAALDFETNPVLDVTIRLDDPATGTSYERSKSLKITVTDVKESMPSTPRNDTLACTAGDDTLDGKGGNDIIKGGAGNDTLIGGTGIDTLFGGAGDDVFKFVTANDSAPEFSGFINNGALNALSADGKRDIVADFVGCDDLLDVSGIDANIKLAGNQAFTWKGDGSFSGKAGELIYRVFDATGTAKDKTIVYGDVNLDGRADFQIELAGIFKLTDSDFIL